MPFEESLSLFHRTLGFTTLFLLAPIALSADFGGPTHKRFGKIYLVCLCVLFATGLFFTFTKHELLSFKFNRNVVFNGFGFYLMFLGVRALKLRSNGERLPAARCDWLMTGALVVFGVSMLAMGGRKWPLLVFGMLALFLFWLDVRAYTGRSHATHLDRHVRYMLGSYFYVITVLSIVDLPAGVKIKWVWPVLLAIPAVALATQPVLRRRLGITRHQSWRLGARYALCIAFTLGAYVLASALGFPVEELVFG